MMTTRTPGARLSALDRKRLLGHLAALGAPDPDERANAAQKAATLLARKGLSWPALIAVADKSDDVDDDPPPDWRDHVQAVLDRPDIDPADRAFLRTLAGWRAPGADGLRRLREIVARIG